MLVRKQRSETSKQRNYYQSSPTFLCFESLTVLFASKYSEKCDRIVQRASFGIKLQNSPKLPHIPARFHCSANEQRAIDQRGVLSNIKNIERKTQIAINLINFVQ